MEQGKTIKQIADELGVSKQAVRNEIAKQKLQSSLQKSENQIFVNNAVEILIKSAFLERQSAKLSEKSLQFTSANFLFMCYNSIKFIDNICPYKGLVPLYP